MIGKEPYGGLRMYVKMKRWLLKILVMIVVRLGMYVAERVDYDLLCEVTEKYEERVKAYQTCVHTCSTCGDELTYEKLKKVEDEWIEKGIIG